jgi:hypothetical protein
MQGFSREMVRELAKWHADAGNKAMATKDSQEDRPVHGQAQPFR